MSQIKKADHICWWCDEYWRHAIVSDVHDGRKLTVIGNILDV